MNRFYIVFSFLGFFFLCNGQTKTIQANDFFANTSCTGNKSTHFGLQDKDGKIWFVSTTSGVSCYSADTLKQFTIQDGLPETCIFSILEDKAGSIWVGTSNGLYKYDKKRFYKIPIPHNYLASAPDAMGNVAYNPNCILSMLQDKKGNLWLGSMGFGVYQYDGEEFHFFIPKQGESYNVVQCIIEDQEGVLYFGTRGEGIWTYDGIMFKNFKSAIVNNNHLLDMLEVKNGGIYFSIVGGGVRYYAYRAHTVFSAYDGERFQNFTQKENPCFINVLSMLQDKKGNVWFGSNGGGMYVQNEKEHTYFTTKNGLCNNIVKGILEDAEGTIWIGTKNGGLCKYNGKIFVDFFNK
ncbi:MAG: hypothetical protein JST67_11795 [Bacteroidetes bacterium]|nr:hypothetical protein [Bacteroidota bacterium]